MSPSCTNCKFLKAKQYRWCYWFDNPPTPPMFCEHWTNDENQNFDDDWGEEEEPE